MRIIMLFAMLMCSGCQNVSVTIFVENDLGNGTRTHAEMAWKRDQTTAVR